MIVTSKSKDIMNTEMHFGTPIYRIEKPEWVTKANKATDKYIKQAEKNLQPELKERKKI